MTEYFNECGLGSYFQSGFRANHSTTTALILFTDDIGLELDRGKVAFDNIDHNILCAKMKRHYGFSKNACDLVHSYLENRRISIEMDGEISGELNIYSGVVQGSVLGPELFKIYISDLPDVVKNAKIHLFADDVRIYMGCKATELNDCSLLINKDLARIHDWSVKNKLYLNHMKSEVMFFAKNPNIHQKPVFHIGENIVSFVEKTKNLGVTFSEDLSWDKHINSICSKVFFTLRSLTNSNMCLPTWLRRKLILTLIVPLLTYGDALFSSANANQIRKLEICFNACLRFIHKRKKFDRLSDIRNTILGCTLSVYYKYRLAVQIFSIILTKQPAYLYDSLTFARSSRTKNLSYPTPKSNYLLESFSVCSAQLWNSLPNWVKLASTINEFKKLLKSHLHFDGED